MKRNSSKKHQKRIIVINELLGRTSLVCRLVSVSPLFFRQGPKGEDLRHVVVVRLHDDGSYGERLGIFLKGDDAYHADLRFGYRTEITYSVDRHVGRIAQELLFTTKISQ